MIIYNYNDSGYYTGLTAEHHSLQTIPKGWTKIPPPEGKFVKYIDRRWVIMSEYIDTKIVPNIITKRQAKQQLLIEGLLEQIPTIISSIEDPIERGLAEIYWEDSQEFERNHPLLTFLASEKMGLTEEELDNLFIKASKL